MKTTVKTGIGVALIWIIFCMLLFYTGNAKAGFVTGIFLNVFLLLASIAVGLYLHKKESGFEKLPFASDFKSAMQSGIVYALIVSSFIYLYHEKIDPTIKDDLVELRMEAIHTMIPDEAAYHELQKEDDTWAEKSYNDYIENQEDIIRSMISSFSIFIFHLMGLIFFSIFYSFFATLILRKIVLRQ